MFTEPKTDRSRRTIAVPAPLIEALRKQRVAQNEERLVAGTEWDDWDLVFAQPNGRPLDKHSDYEAWIKLLNRAEACGTSACTTAATPRRRCCSPPASTRAS